MLSNCGSGEANRSAECIGTKRECTLPIIDLTALVKATGDRNVVGGQSVSQL